MRHAGISADGKDHALSIFRASFCQPKFDLALNIGNGERCAISFDEHFILADLVVLQECRCFAYNACGTHTHLADALDFIGAFCTASFQQNFVIHVADKFNLWEGFGQTLNKWQNLADFLFSIKHYSALGDAQVA